MYMYTRTICALSSQRCDIEVVSLLTRPSVAHFLISTHVLIPCARESRAKFRGGGGGGGARGISTPLLIHRPPRPPLRSWDIVLIWHTKIPASPTVYKILL